MKIGNIELKEGRSYIVAEMSANHCGSLDRAKEIILRAKESGADAIKLQTYRPDTITLDSQKEDFKLSAGPWKDYGNLYDLYKVGMLPWEWHKDLYDYAREIGIEIFSSPFDETAVELLESLNSNVYKLASPEITDIPLIARMAQTGKPIIISTGLASVEDIELAIKTFKDNGGKDVLLLKCTSAYPTPLEEVNLLTLTDMKKRFKCPIGISDHTPGFIVPVTGVALGITFIEKHFTLEANQDSLDEFFSLTPSEFKTMVQNVRDAEKCLGQVFYDVTESSKVNLRGRRSLYVSQNIRKGEKITDKNIKSVRPSFGLHPKHYWEILGKTVTKDLEAGDRLSWDVIDK